MTRCIPEGFHPTKKSLARPEYAKLIQQHESVFEFISSTKKGERSEARVSSRGVEMD